ncbi:MAG: metal ABC transporter substrate-binding protein [bacterium]
MDQTEKMEVAATIFPLYDIVKIVGGEKINPILILPPGSSPHTFEVSPSQVKQMQNVKLIFSIGMGMDAWAENIAQVVNNADIINLDQYIALKPFELQGHKEEPAMEDGHSHENMDPNWDVDPHYWLDPDNARIMAIRIARHLGAIDAANKSYYESRAQDFIDDLMAKDSQWEEKINLLNKKEIVVFHDAWGYFADHFGLKIVATFEPFPGKSPSPQYLINLQNAIKTNNITALFVEPQLSKEAITALADDLKVKVDVLDPLGGIGERNSYINMIEYNVKNIYDALK